MSETPWTAHIEAMRQMGTLTACPLCGGLGFDMEAGCIDCVPDDDLDDSLGRELRADTMPETPK